jgi:hypothetical protein
LGDPFLRPPELVHLVECPFALPTGLDLPTLFLRQAPLLRLPLCPDFSLQSILLRGKFSEPLGRLLRLPLPSNIRLPFESLGILLSHPVPGLHRLLLFSLSFRIEQIGRHHGATRRGAAAARRPR